MRPLHVRRDTQRVLNELHAGDQLDHFQIESLAAESGMARIYRATDVRDGRIVAIKVPHFEVECDPLLFDRFKREEQIGKKLDHPGVVRVLHNEDPSRLYMVMEWLDGVSLRRILDGEKKLPMERAARLTIEICEALEYIHSRGVVHRDLKPENIFVDSGDHPKLIDFGIAGSSGARRLTFGTLTRTMGTADYISPEQVKRRRGDARSDVYSVGVMLYEMLTGELPFQGPNVLAVINDRLVNDPIPPRESNPQISPQLEEIIYRALEREPENRYAAARDFADDLRNPDAVDVVARAEKRGQQAPAAVKPKRVLLYAAIAMIPIVIMVLLLITAHSH